MLTGRGRRDYADDVTDAGEPHVFHVMKIKGDTVQPRRSDMRSEHQGQFWIGTFERAGDKPQGTLTSVPFKVTHPWKRFCSERCQRELRARYAS